MGHAVINSRPPEDDRLTRAIKVAREEYIATMATRLSISPAFCRQHSIMWRRWTEKEPAFPLRYSNRLNLAARERAGNALPSPARAEGMK
jgi:hypothetical protein